MKRRKRKGLLLSGDDLAVGCYCTVHHGTNFPPFLKGESLQVKAINLPFIVVRTVAHLEAPPFTIDIRECALMPVTAEFVAAQTNGTPPTKP
jgi:hypothetical protein